MNIQPDLFDQATRAWRKDSAARACGRDITANRHKGNPESVKAFKRLKPAMPQARAEVFNAIRNENGITCKELAAAWGVGMNAISGRFSELKRDGRIEKTGTRGGCAVYVAK